MRPAHPACGSSPSRDAEEPDLEVLEDGHRVEDVGALGHVVDAVGGDVEWLQSDHLHDAVTAIEADAARADVDEPVRRLQQRGLAGAVRPDDRHQLCGVHVERDAVEDPRVATVAGVESLDRQDGAGHEAPSDVELAAEDTSSTPSCVPR